MNREPPDRTTSVKGDTVRRNVTFAFATQMSSAVFTAVLTIYLARALGPADFGTFALALGISGLLLRPADIGTTQSAARFVAERHGDTTSIVGVLGMALRTRLVTATGLAIALFVLAGPIASLYDEPGLIWPLRGVAISLFGQGVFGFATIICTALRRTSTGLMLTASESAIEFSATVALVLLGGGAAGAAFGRAIGYVFGAVLGVVMLGRLLGRSPLFRTGPSPVRRREFVRYAGAMFVVQGAQVAFRQTNVLLIGAFLGATAVGFYSAPMRLVGFLGYPVQALAQGIGPRMVRHPDRAPSVTALERALRYTVILQTATVVFVTVWAEPIVELVLGAEFSESAEVLRAAAPFLFLTGFGPLLVVPLNYMGEAGRRIPIALGAVAINVVIAVVLIPRIGVVGAVIGSNVAFGVYAGAHLWLCHRVLGLRLRPLGTTAARSFLAAAPMAAVLVLLGTGSLTPLAWAVGLLGGGVAFLTTLVVSREMSLNELRSVAALPLRALRAD